MNVPGRTCPLHYRYGAAAISSAPLREAETLYVIGGLYGNLPALDAVEALGASEQNPVTLCFNGDFNWFNVDASGFRSINERVLRHHAILGNVEAELHTEASSSGCGCAYPDEVDSHFVDRSNQIHALLKQTAQHHPDLLANIASLPMFARYHVGSVHVGVVHGDADSLAGWRFDTSLPNQMTQDDWLYKAFKLAEVDVFASTHTCLPVLRDYLSTEHKVIINNGAAGMPNFVGTKYGLLTRISVHPSPHVPLYGVRLREVYIDSLPVYYDSATWQQEFLTNWPAGSPAWISYFSRINDGPNHPILQTMTHKQPA